MDHCSRVLEIAVRLFLYRVSRSEQCTFEPRLLPILFVPSVNRICRAHHCQYINAGEQLWYYALALAIAIAIAITIAITIEVILEIRNKNSLEIHSFESNFGLLVEHGIVLILRCRFICP